MYLKLFSLLKCDLVAYPSLMQTAQHLVNGTIQHTADIRANHVSVSEDERLHRLLQDSSWRTESFGCAFEGKTVYSADDKRALRILEATIRNVGNRYETRMLWRYEQPSLPFSSVLAEGRFAHLERKFTCDTKRRGDTLIS